jgi:ribosomal-protein-alanine N-acetyltransferase
MCASCRRQRTVWRKDLRLVIFAAMVDDAVPEILSQRLRLWMPAPADASLIQAYTEENRLHLARWSPPVPPDYHGLAYWERRLEQNRAEVGQDRSLRLAISWRDDPRRIIGTVNLSEFVRGPFQNCFLGYGLDHREQGRGAMTEAVRAACDYAFTSLGFHRIQANYMPVNERSGGVLRRCGFVVEGYARDYLYIHGAWRDHILTALINPKPVPPPYA